VRKFQIIVSAALLAFSSAQAFAQEKPPCDITGHYYRCPTCAGAQSHPLVTTDTGDTGAHYVFKNADNATTDAHWAANEGGFEVANWGPNHAGESALSDANCTSLTFSDGTVWSRH